MSIKQKYIDLLDETKNYINNLDTDVIISDSEHLKFFEKEINSTIPKKQYITSNKPRQFIKPKENLPFASEEKPSNNQAPSFEEMKSLFKDSLQDVEIVENPLLSNQKTIFLLSAENEAEIDLIKKILQAIKEKLKFPTEIIDIKKINSSFLNENNYRLILCPQDTLKKSTPLLSIYKKDTKLKKQLLNKTELFILFPISSYIEKPELKKDLWQNLTKALKKS
jgi:hypothetical protein